MIRFARTDQSIFGRWWWTVDRVVLGLVCFLMLLGCMMILAASPAVATRVGLDHFYFVERHLEVLLPAFVLMIGVSMLTPRQIRIVGLIGFVAALAMVAATLFVGVEIKGARRWIHLPGLSIQPSEFLKPTFAVVAAWLFSIQSSKMPLAGRAASGFLYFLSVALLLLQPDLGMTVVVSVVWIAQFFLAGLPIILLILIGLLGSAGLVGSYFVFPHVAARVHRFLNPENTDNYQVQRSLEAFMNGGMFGTGPGEGTVKMTLPDAHADFIFSVMGEEVGMFGCLILVGVFFAIVLRCLWKMRDENNLFILLAVSGLAIQFGLQALINMGSTMHLIPAKGMTMPFVSYGGSSLWALALGVGMMLGLARKRYGTGDPL